MTETKTGCMVRRLQITDINFVKKNSKQRARTLKSDPRQLPWMTTHAADRDADGHLAGGIGNFKETRRWPGVRGDCCDMELKLVLFAICMWWMVRQHSVAVCLGSFRRQMTVVKIIIADLHCLSISRRRVGLCVFV